MALDVGDESVRPFSALANESFLISSNVRESGRYEFRVGGENISASATHASCFESRPSLFTCHASSITFVYD